ncbi:MAG: DegV family protein [Athalassotoga sp.]
MGKVEANIGEFLNVKPIISVDKDGILYSYVKILGWRRAIDKMLDIFFKESQGKKVNVAVMNGGDEEEAKEFVMKRVSNVLES